MTNSKPARDATPLRKPEGTNRFGTKTDRLHAVLRALGHSNASVVSVSTREAGKFRAETRVVGSLTEWTPPNGVDVWFSPNPLRALMPPGVRGGVADVERGRAMYADLDVTTPGLKTKGLASIAECELVVEELSAAIGADPVAVIYSGHGLQPIWRIDEAEPIDDGAVRWRTTSARWATLVRSTVAGVNPDAVVDSVFNIDRILRCPGSTNWKDPGTPTRVECMLNPNAEGLLLDHLDSVLPATDVTVSATHLRVRAAAGDRLLDSFRGGSMSAAVVAKVNDVVAAVESGGDRHPTMNTAVQGLVGLGSRGHRGVLAALKFVESTFAEVADEHADPAEFERSLSGALRNVAGAPEYRPMDFRTGTLFNTDGSVREGSWLAELKAQGRTQPSRLDSPPRERFAAVGAADLALPVPPMEWLIDGVWPANSFGPVGGEKKTLKSNNLMAIALAVSSGLPLFGEFKVESAGPVLYYAAEGGQAPFQRRLQSIAAGYEIDDLGDLPLHAVFDVGGLDEDEFTDALRRHLDVLQPSLVILDPLYAFHPAGIEAGNLYDRGRMLAQFTNELHGQAALMIADHFKKTGASALDLDSISQAGMGQWADSWVLQRHRRPPDLDAGTYNLAVEFGSRQWGGSRWDLDWHLPTITELEAGAASPVSWSIERSDRTGQGGLGADAIDHRILSTLRVRPGTLTESQLAKAVGGNKTTAKSAIDRLRADGLISAKSAKRREGTRDVTREVLSAARFTFTVDKDDA